MSIVWTVQEELPLGTTIGTVKDILFKLNDNRSQFMDKIHIKFDYQNVDAYAFLVNSTTGMFITHVHVI
jgi:hypothetical protein